MTTFATGTNASFLTAKLNISSATTTAVIAAVSNQLIKVYKAVILCAAAQTIDVKDNTTSLTGPMTFAVGVPLVLNLDGNPWWVASLGNALNFTTTTTGQVSGTLYYLTQNE